MKITKQLTPSLAVQLTETVDDWEQILNSNLSEWFKGVYGICMLFQKTELYKKCRPDVDAEELMQEWKEKQKTRQEIEDKSSKKGCAYFR